MSYPQQDVNKYVVNGYKFFRLNTLLTSDGDIYESPVSGAGIAIGPDSDISKVNLAYFDEQVPNFLNQISVSLQRPFAGFIAARNEVQYAPAQRDGRILIWPDELYNSSFRPSGFDSGNMRFDQTVPVLDVVQYFEDTQLAPMRNDKTYRILNVPFQANAWYYMFPTYGRRMRDFTILNQLTGTTGIHYAITGVRFNYRSNTSLGTAEIPVVASTALANEVAVHKQSNASTDGLFDMMYIKITSDDAPTIPTGQVPITITVSDRQV